MGKTCCGFGHRIVLMDVDNALRKIIYDLIKNQGVTRFLTGGMGEFDDLFAKAVCSMRDKYPQIQLCLVIPYLTKRLNDQKELLFSLYDEIIFPADLDGANKKVAIPFRNRWIVDNSDFAISAVHRDFGGAYEAVTYAERRGVQIIKIGGNLS